MKKLMNILIVTAAVNFLTVTKVMGDEYREFQLNTMISSLQKVKEYGEIAKSLKSSSRPRISVMKHMVVGGIIGFIMGSFSRLLTNKEPDNLRTSGQTISITETAAFGNCVISTLGAFVGAFGFFAVAMNMKEIERAQEDQMVFKIMKDMIKEVGDLYSLPEVSGTYIGDSLRKMYKNLIKIQRKSGKVYSHAPTIRSLGRIRGQGDSYDVVNLWQTAKVLDCLADVGDKASALITLN
jgi:hypothetical protein